MIYAIHSLVRRRYLFNKGWRGVGTNVEVGQHDGIHWRKLFERENPVGYSSTCYSRTEVDVVSYL
jgi:hypothetical protein